MKIAPQTKPGTTNLLQPSPHANWQFPLCPKYVEPLVTDKQSFWFGEPNLGDGTTYPVESTWWSNARHYSRVAELVLRKGSFYKAINRMTGELFDFQFGPLVGPTRVQLQYELACGAIATVSQMQEKIDSGGLHQTIYRIIMGYGFIPEIGVSTDFQGNDAEPVWNIGSATYLNQFAAVSAYFAVDVLTRGLISVLPRINDQNPPDRYEKCGVVEYDLIDQTKQHDDEHLHKEFPLYRDLWIEDGNPHDAHPAPAIVKSLDARIKLGYINFDFKPDGLAEVTGEMIQEMTPQ